MTLSATISRAIRFGTDPELGGVEDFEGTNTQPINAIIPAATADVQAICSINRAQVRAIGFRSDYPVTVRFVGSYPVTVTASNLVAGYGTSTFVIDEPLPAWIQPGDDFAVVDCDNDHGTMWTLYNLNAARTTLYPHGNLLGGATEGEVGVIVPVSNRIFPVLTSAVIPLTFTVEGQFDGVVGDIARVCQRPLGDGNGLFSILANVYDAATNISTVTVYDDVLAGAAGPAGFMQAYSFEYRINLAAGVPYIWSIESGLPCPLICDVTELRITNAGANDADVQGRIVTAAP